MMTGTIAGCRLPVACCLLFFSAALTGCGGGAECGNGKIEEGEQCDDGNTNGGDACSPECKALKTVDTFLHFSPFIATQFPDFKGENCTGLQIKEVEITLAGPKMLTQRADCGLTQLKLSSLPDGQYTATGKAYDSSGAALTKGMAKVSFTVAGKNQDVQLDWPYEDFMKSYTGTFFFDVLWGGSKTCAGPVPPVARQRLRLERNGIAVAGMVQTGEPLDGSATGACVDVTSLSQAAPGIVWGPARFIVTGEDSDGTAIFKKSFDTFVGAGITNNPISYDVPSLLPDAGPADAAQADGGS